MIAHRIQRKSGKDAFGRLARYITDLDKSADLGAFARVAEYIADSKGADNRVVGLRISNCGGGDDFALAVKEIENTQASNKRGRGDKSYHLVFSFPEGERPTLDQLRQIEDALVAAIGLEEHQRVSAIHDDTSKLHVHVAINKVHPTSKRLVEPFYDKQKLMAACIALEAEHGLTRVNHGQRAERMALRVGDKMAAYAGRVSLQNWVAEEAAPELRNALATATGWQDVHRAFREQGLELRLRGAGLVATAIGQNVSVKASSIDRALSLGALTKRLGEFAPPTADVALVNPRRRYTKAVTHQSPEAAALYAEYQADRAEAQRMRAIARADLAQAHDRYSQNLRAHYRDRYAALRGNVHLRREERVVQRAALAAERAGDQTARRDAMRAQRQQIDASNPLLTWQAYLQREAELGDDRAVTAIRRQAASRGRAAGDVLTAPDLAAARDVVARGQKITARRNGEMIYSVADGGRVADQVGAVRVESLSAAAALLALELAQARFGDQPLIIEGSEAFMEAIIASASMPGSAIRFEDPALEARRVAAAERRGMDFDPSLSGAAAYVAERNGRNAAGVLPHRVWTAADVGEFTYAGRRGFMDGSEGVLLERDGQIYVKPAGDVQMAKASSWRRGEPVTLDKQGRFRANPGADRTGPAPTIPQ